MLHREDLSPLLKGKNAVFGSDGERIGTLGRIYLDDGTDLPDFATVNTGMFGTKGHLVPLTDAEISNGQLYVKFTRQFVKEAPNIDAAGRLSPEDEARLYDYYSQAGLGRGHDPDPGPGARPGAGPAGGPRHRTTQDPGADPRNPGRRDP